MSNLTSQEQVQTAYIPSAQSGDDGSAPLTDKGGVLDAAADVIPKTKADSLGRSSLVGELLGKLEKLTILIGSDQDAMYKSTLAGGVAAGDSVTGGVLSRPFVMAATQESSVHPTIQPLCSEDCDEHVVPNVACLPPATSIHLPLALLETSAYEATVAGDTAVPACLFNNTAILGNSDACTPANHPGVLRNQNEHFIEYAEADRDCGTDAIVCGSECDGCTSGTAFVGGRYSSDDSSCVSSLAHVEMALPEDGTTIEGAQSSLQLFESVLQEVTMQATREGDRGAEAAGVVATTATTGTSANLPMPFDPPLADILLEEELLWITGGLAAATAAAAEPPRTYAVGDLIDEGVCGICLGAVGLVAPVRRRLCCHLPVCQSCIAMYFALRVAEGCAAIQCPAATCTSNVAKDEVADFLSPELRSRYNRIIENANCSPFAKTCPHCCHLNSIDAEATETPAAKRTGLKVACAVCAFSWCFTCHAPWHEGITCSQYRNGDKALKVWAKEKHFGQLNARKCPRCKILIQRVSGCDHIHCKQCETDFCYRCGKRHVRIRFIGDHYEPLSILGCPYAFMQGKQKHLRRFVRGSIFTGQVLAVPVGISLAIGLLPIAVTTVAIAGPVLGFMRLHRHLKQRKQAAKRHGITTNVART